MEYGKLFTRSAEVVWQNKFLIVLGILASLAGGGSFGSSWNTGGGDGTTTGPIFGEPGQVPQFQDEVAGLAIGIIIALICVGIFVGLILWAISTIARGGLVAGVDSVESGQKSGFGEAWRAGWKKAGPLLGIGIIPAIPGLILFVIGLFGLVAYGGLAAFFGGDIAGPIGGGELGIIIVLLLCVVAPVALVLSILRNFAERACMIENYGVVDSYKRGWKVLTSNLGEAIILFVLQVVIAVALGIALIVPGIFLAVCCFLWPLLIIIQGAITGYISTLWTLAYRQWIGKAGLMVAKEPAAL
jgi:hypothetical protein